MPPPPPSCLSWQRAGPWAELSAWGSSLPEQSWDSARSALGPARSSWRLHPASPDCVLPNSAAWPGLSTGVPCPVCKESTGKPGGQATLLVPDPLGSCWAYQHLTIRGELPAPGLTWVRELEGPGAGELGRNRHPLSSFPETSQFPQPPSQPSSQLLQPPWLMRGQTV